MMTPAVPVRADDAALPGPSRLRWLMIALVFLATVMNYLDRQTLSVAAPVLTRAVPHEQTSNTRA